MRRRTIFQFQRRDDHCRIGAADPGWLRGAKGRRFPGIAALIGGFLALLGAFLIRHDFWQKDDEPHA